ncbi:MAG: hypothetical protein FWD34_00050 [Oscillospiraceae bacterium]|nr:hypothetical protein [Oscillospiraceae bacterium]
MSNKKIPTDVLLKRLFKTTSIDRFIHSYSEDLNNPPVFCDYINSLCSQKDISHESVIKKADIARTYGHQLFSGTRKPTRDRVIQLAFGFEMDYEETQKFLVVARKSQLYPKIKRDAIIIFALKNGYGVVDVQSALYDLSIPILGEER